MIITIEHIPTQSTWVMYIKNLEYGIKNMNDIFKRDTDAGISFYSKSTCNYVHISPAIANECVFYLVSESEEDKQQMKEYFE